jgi:hypothetical protein
MVGTAPPLPSHKLEASYRQITKEKRGILQSKRNKNKDFCAAGTY